MTNNRIRVSFIVYDYDKDFGMLSQYLTIEPTFTQEAKKAESVRRRWELASGANEGAALEEHLASLLGKIQPISEQVNKLAKSYECIISVGLEYREFNPEIVIDPETLNILASLGVKLWLDIYNLWDGKSDHAAHN